MTYKEKISQATTRFGLLAIALVFLSTLSLQVALPTLTYAQEDAYVDGANMGDDNDDASAIKAGNLPDDPDQPPEATPPDATPTEDEKVATKGVPTSFAGRTQCTTKISEMKLADAKKYTDVRAKNRYAQLKKYSVRIDNANKAVKNSYKPEAKKYKIDKDIDVQRITHRKEIKKEINNTQNLVKAKQKAAKDATTPQAVAEQVCSMIYDIRIYTYLNGKITKQTTIDKYYRHNSLAQAQYTTLKNEYGKLGAEKAKKAEVAINALGDPAATKAKIDASQAKLDGIKTETINQAQLATKKKATVIFTETMKAEQDAAKAAIESDIKTANTAKKALKTAKTGSSNASSSSAKRKLKLAPADQDSICKNASTAVLQTKNKLSKDLSSACYIGIKEGFQKKGDANKFCKTGGGKWNASKSPKKVAACEHGYTAGVNFRNAL